jgi:hypothetical protein
MSGEPGVGEVVAQVVEISPGAVGADRLAGRLDVAEGLVSSYDLQPVQYPPVAGVGGEPVGVAFAAQGADLA